MRALRLLGVLGLVSLFGATCADGLTHAAALTTQGAGPLVDLGSGAGAGAGVGPMPVELEAPAVADVFRVIDLTGVFGNAAVGGVIARAERLDPVGFATLAILSGLGGGMIRDTLLQVGPPAALLDAAYVLTALAAAAVTFAVTVEGRVWDRLWPVVDAIALGSWAAAGSLKTLATGLGWLPAILLGTITAVGGGALRDIVLRRTPTVLGGNTLYATCAAIAAAVMVGAYAAGQSNAGLLVSTGVGASLCLLARRYGWMLPAGDSWSPRQVVPRRARRSLSRRREALRARRAAQAERRRRPPTAPPE